MKNVHLLLAGESYLSLNCSYRDSAIGTQVGKPYWTYSKEWKHHLSVTDASVRPHNIYITSDEEIKEGDWVFDLDTKRIVKADSFKVTTSKKSQCWYYKKIILTTDQDLIKDGVQAIDDEFLEWFVKNPSCEFVEIRYNIGTYNPDYLKFYEVAPPKSYYKITIPKETLEEVAETFLPNSEIEHDTDFIIGFITGVKWQAERMYSEEEVLHLMTLAFEQGFKKADVVEAGLEAKETDTEVNWIFLKHKK